MSKCLVTGDRLPLEKLTPDEGMVSDNFLSPL